MLTYRTPIVVTKHAQKRWKQYSKSKMPGQSVLRNKLNGSLMCGFANKNRGVEFYVTGRIKAVCVPAYNGWIIVTFKSVKRTSIPNTGADKFV